MNITIGATLAPFGIETVSPESMKEWAVFLHDPNPIHLDVEVVKAKGLGEKVINQGPANVAYVINMLAAAFHGGRIRKIDCRFLDNVYAGDRLEAGGTITAVTSEQVVCDVWLRANGFRTVISGSATIQL